MLEIPRAEASTLIKAPYLLTPNLEGFYEARKTISTLSIAVKSNGWKKGSGDSPGDTCWCLSKAFLSPSSYGHILFLSHSDD